MQGLCPVKDSYMRNRLCLFFASIPTKTLEGRLLPLNLLSPCRIHPAKNNKI